MRNHLILPFTKKVLLLVLLTAGLLPVYAQTSIGIIAGGNLNRQYSKEDTGNPNFYEESQSTSSWRAGVVTEHHLAGKFFLQPQLLLNNKGQKNTFVDRTSTLRQENRKRLLYLELQANVLFKQKIGKDAIFIGAGPYFGRGIDGIVATKGSNSEPTPVRFDNYYVVKYRNDIPDQGPNATPGNVIYTKPIDAGISFQLGYACKNGLFFNGVYSLGLTNTAYSKDYPTRNRYIGLSIGYYFKRMG